MSSYLISVATAAQSNSRKATQPRHHSAVPPSSVTLSPANLGITSIIVQCAHPSQYMAGPPQPQNPAQGDAGDDSGPHKAQKHTNIPDAPSEKELRQILEEQEVGKFDFDRDFGVIKSEDDFEHRLWEYDRMMDDETKRPTDFPVDPKIQGLFVRKVAEAILNMEGATDKKIKDRKRSSKSWTTTTDSKTDVPANEDPGDKEKNSVAVSFLNGLKLTEVELLSWKIVVSFLTF